MSESLIGILKVVILTPIAMIGIPMAFDVFILGNDNYWWHRDRRRKEEMLKKKLRGSK